MLIGVQYLRAIAALMVVFHHSLSHVYTYSGKTIDIRFGASGVDIFFVISGFIMVYVTSSREATPLAFVKARFIRVAPLYWVYLAIAVARYEPSVDHAVRSFLFIPTWHPSYDHRAYPPLVAGWTLNYEMFFYLMFSLGLWVRHRMAFTTTALLALIAIGILTQSATAPGFVYTNPLLLEFIAGMWLARMYLSGWRPSGWTAVPLIVVGIAGLLMANSYGEWAAGAEGGLPAVMIVSGVLVLEKNGAILSWRTFVLLGDASYTVYLSHTFVLGRFTKAWNYFGLDILPEPLRVASSVCFAAAVGIVLYFLIERPMLWFFKRVMAGGTRRTKPASGGAPS